MECYKLSSNIQLLYESIGRLLRDPKLIHTWQIIPSFSNFVSETISSRSFIKTYQNPPSAEEHVTTSEFCNTERILVAKEKCLKTCTLPDGFHATTEGPVHKLQSASQYGFALKRACTVVHCALSHRNVIFTHTKPFA